jgi:adenosylcobyric acid synthase
MKPIHEAGEISPEGSQNVSDTMNVYGTYVHGVFDGEGIAKSVVEALLAKISIYLNSAFFLSKNGFNIQKT